MNKVDCLNRIESLQLKLDSVNWMELFELNLIFWIEWNHVGMGSLLNRMESFESEEQNGIERYLSYVNSHMIYNRKWRQTGSDGTCNASADFLLASNPVINEILRFTLLSKSWSLSWRWSSNQPLKWNKEKPRGQWSGSLNIHTLM